MKKFVLTSLVIALAALTLTGCSSTSSSGGTGTSAIPTADLAASVGVAAKNALTIDNSILGVISAAGVKSSGVNAAVVNDLAYTGGWWSATNNYAYTEGGTTITFSYAYNFRFWNVAGTELTTLSALKTAITGGDISKGHVYATFTYDIGGSTSTTYYGNSKDDPLKFEGLGTTTPTISGTLKYAGTYSTTSYSMTFTYASLGMTSGGYPNGEISYSVTEAGAGTVSGKVTYTGTKNATITVVTKAGTSTFTCDLDTGAVTAASL